MKEQNDVTKVEFLITLNNNFVVQRFFNVKNYHEKAESSVELYEYIKYLSESLQTKLRNKCMVYMLDNRYQIEEDPSVLETSNSSSTSRQLFFASESKNNSHPDPILLEPRFK